MFFGGGDSGTDCFFRVPSAFFSKYEGVCKFVVIFEGVFRFFRVPSGSFSKYDAVVIVINVKLLYT